MKWIISIVTTLLLPSVSAFAETDTWQSVEHIFNRKGMIQGNVFKATFPRTDLNVQVDTLRIEPGLALTSWIALGKMDSHVMAMGDLVLKESELKTVQAKLIQNGFQISGIHNHIVGENPSIIYMHIDGHGEADTLAKGFIEALKATETPLVSNKEKQSTPDLATEKQLLETHLNASAKQNGNVIQFAIQRKETILENGMPVPPAMGLATVINFQQAGKNRLATTGDFALQASEVNPVIETLVQHGFTVTAVHNHMLHESPRLFFLHFWGIDTIEKLGMALKSALDHTQSKTGR
jgi:hypothetical protein